MEALVNLWKITKSSLMKDCPYKTNTPDYHRYRRKVVSGFLAWLYNFTCQECEHYNPTKMLDFHHVNPDNKVDAVSNLVKKGKYTEAMLEVFKCEYLCALCHYKRHAKLGDIDEDFQTINRRRHTYIQNLLGCPD